MQKSDDDIKLFSTDSSLKTNVSLDEIKTTNVNILLNRVRTNNKKKLRKKIVFVSILSFIISIFSFISLT